MSEVEVGELEEEVVGEEGVDGGEVVVEANVVVEGGKAASPEARAARSASFMDIGAARG